MSRADDIGEAPLAQRHLTICQVHPGQQNLVAGFGLGCDPGCFRERVLRFLVPPQLPKQVSPIHLVISRTQLRTASNIDLVARIQMLKRLWIFFLLHAEQGRDAQMRGR